MDAVPGGNVDDAIATAKHFRQLRPVENGSLDEHRSLFQSPWRTDIENDGRITPVEQPGYESLAEITRPACQKHLHRLLRHLPLFSAGNNRCRQDRLVPHMIWDLCSSDIGWL